MFSVRIQAEPINLAPAEGTGRDDCGAQVRFVGTVRNDARSAPISHLVLEHFPGVTESEIERIVGLARQRWNLQKAQVVHRVGRIGVGEDIVVVETASAHRKDAFEANIFIMDYLKTQAPFWKQECFTDGSEHWVEAKSSDQQAAQRWSVAQAGAATPSASASQEPDAAPRRIGALILAGGEGSRMGYRNKGLQPFRGQPLVMNVAETLRPHVAYIGVSANNDVAEYQALGFPVFQDDPAYGLQGPLAGVVSALPRFPAWLDALLVVPCDVPLLPADLVPRLAEALAPAEVACTMAITEGTSHHGIFLCRPGMLLSLVPHLREMADLRLRSWLQRSHCEFVHFENTDAFANINDLQTLQALEA
ncbi:MAG: molybdenum cofactor guanylyltransferase [Alcaligenaceae bacterium]|nr:molybdenum cofactor guanylyltransferase [Alcaligenaceae bacterium]